MRISALFLLAPLLLAAHGSQDRPITDPGKPKDWVPYHRISSEDGSLDYAYDRKSVRRASGHVAVRSRTTGNGTTMFFTMDIDCEKGLASETGTVIVHADGKQEVVPANELVANYPIGTGSFADKLKTTLCR